MRLDNVKVDFQFTGWSVEKDKPARFGALSRALLKRAEKIDRSLLGILEAASKTDGNRAVVLCDYYQPKYQRVIDEGLKEASKICFVDDNHRDTFVGLSSNGNDWFYVIRGKEYMCAQGHIIAAATPKSLPTRESWYTHGPNVEDVLDFEDNTGALLIPSHPLSKFGLIGKTILKTIREPSGTNLGLQEKTIRKYADNFDALEAFSLSMDPKQTARVDNLARELGIPTVSNTDADLDGSFTAYNSFDWLDFGNPESLRQSIRAGLQGKGNSFTEHREGFPKSTKDKLRHIWINVLQNRKYF